jgi:hypothetical protein
MLKQRFFSRLIALGFLIDTTHQPMSTVFRRRRGDRVQILDVSWDKYGRPRFRVTFGTCPSAGLTIGAETFPPDEVLPGWCPDAGNLQRGRGAGWTYRQDATRLQRLLGQPRLRPADAVVDDLLELFPELERWWQSGEVGPHLRFWHPQFRPRPEAP